MPGENSINPLDLGLGIGSIGTSLIGGALNAWSTASTNKTNLKIAQMNNEFNEQMLEKQMSYNREMWNAENEYNTPANQRARLEEAGLNPYMMMDGGSSGNASSAGSVGMPTASPVQFTAPQFDTQSVIGAIGQLGNLMTNGFLARQQGIGQGIENQFAEAMNAQKLALLAEQVNKTKFEGKKGELEFNLMSDTYDNLVNKTKLENDNLQASIDVQRAQKAVMQWDAKIKEVQLRFLPAEKKAELAVKAQQLANMVLEGKIMKRQAALILAQTCAVYKSMDVMDSQMDLNYSQRAVNASEAAKNWADADSKAPQAYVGRKVEEAYDRVGDVILNTAIEQIVNDNQREKSRIPWLEGFSGSMDYTPGDYVRGVERRGEFVGGFLLK